MEHKILNKETHLGSSGSRREFFLPIECLAGDIAKLFEREDEDEVGVVSFNARLV
jgi:hypothetical protein